MTSWQIKISYSCLALLFAILSVAFTPGNVFAQGLQIMRDAEIESFLQELARPLIIQHQMKANLSTYDNDIINGNEFKSPRYKSTYVTQGGRPVPVYNLPKPDKAAPGLDPMQLYSKQRTKPIDVEFFLVDNKQCNAFVYGGKKIYVHSGLIAAYSNSNLLSGVIAHELGHVFNAHLIRGQIDAREAQRAGMTIATFIGLLSAPYGGAASAIGGLMAGTSFAADNMMSFSRGYEREADISALRVLERSQTTSQGLLDLMLYFHEKTGDIGMLQSYFQTHPLPQERLDVIKRFNAYEDRQNIIINPKLEEKFQRIRAKIIGYYGDSFFQLKTRHSQMPDALKNKTGFFRNYQDLYRNFAGANYKDAISLGKEMLRSHPNDPYINEVIGQSYCLLKEPGMARFHLDITRSHLKNHPIIEYEYAQCLINQDGISDVEDGIKILNSLRIANPEETSTRQLLIQAANKAKKKDLYVLSSAELAIINGNIDAAKKMLGEIISEPDFDNKYEYSKEIKMLMAAYDK